MVSYFSSSLGEWDPGSRWKELIGEEWVKETGKLLLDHWIMWRSGVGTLCLGQQMFKADPFPHRQCWWVLPLPEESAAFGSLLLMKVSLFRWPLMTPSPPKGISWYFHLFSAVIFLLLQMTLRQLLGWSHADSLSWITLEKHSCTLCPSKLWGWRSPVQPPQFASAIRIANLSLAL